MEEQKIEEDLIFSEQIERTAIIDEYIPSDPNSIFFPDEFLSPIPGIEVD